MAPVGSPAEQRASFQRNLNVLVQLVGYDFEAVDRHLQAADFHFPSFSRFIAWNQLRGYLYTVLVEEHAEGLFPPRWIDHLRARHLKQTKKNETLLHELKGLAEAFSEAGESFILLKGLYLAQRFYGRFDRRTFWDIDVLVRPEALPEIQSLLRGKGFVRESPILISEALSTRFTHAFDYARPGVRVDLHWMLTNHPSFRLQYDRIWREKQRYAVAEAPYFVLSDEYELVFNLLSVVKDLERGALRMRSLVDLHMILKAVSGAIDWPSFFEARRRERVFTLCLNTLALFLNVFERRDAFPDLATVIDRERACIRLDEPFDVRLLAPSRFALRSKRWVAPLYETSYARYVHWWFLSLPFRLIVYKPGKLSRLKKNLRRGRRETGPTPL